MTSSTDASAGTRAQKRIDTILDRALGKTVPVSDPIAFPLGASASAYPAELVSIWDAPDGTPVTIRPVRPADAELTQAFVKSLSPQTRYLRFMSGIRELSLALLARLTRIDYDRDMALIAVVHDANAEREIGVARYVRVPDGKSAEMAIVVADDWQRRGLSRRLLTQLIEIARARGLTALFADVLSVNHPMLALSRALGFQPHDPLGDGLVTRLTLNLEASSDLRGS